MLTNSSNLTVLLDNLEAELQALGLWESEAPPEDAFQSSLPFHYDTMTFLQWLQWILIARFRAMVAEEIPLPTSCQVAPMAEEYFRELDGPDGVSVIRILQQIDASLSVTS